MTERGCSIRPYEPADLDAVVDVWYRASQVAHSFLSEEFFAREAERIRSEHMLRARVWVGERDGVVVGFIAMLGNEVGALFVDPAHHRRGIGRALMDEVSAGHDTLELEVFEANALGRAFYERYGFVRVDSGVDEETGQPMLRLRLSR